MQLKLKSFSASLNYATWAELSSDFILAQGLIDENIYAAFIHYCGLDRSDFIHPDFRRFFSEIPHEYNRRASIEEKMTILRREGKIFGVHQLNKLMQMIRNHFSISAKLIHSFTSEFIARTTKNLGKI